MDRVAARLAARSYPQIPLRTVSVWMRLGNVAKRCMDLCLALLGLVLLAPLFIVIGIMLKREEPGSIFYRGRRVGKNGKEFLICKFRTMKEPPEANRGSRVTAKDDPRITSFGRWLRETKINELPQLWNVVKGEMSLVGPRPEDPEIVSTWPAEVRREILAVAPGVTSPASVLYRNEEVLLNSKNVMQTYMKTVLPSKLRLDQLYVRHHSIGLDLDILFWTAAVLLPLLRSFTPAEESLFLGPISRLARRYINWFAADLLITFAAIGIAGGLWRYFGPLDVGWHQSLILAAGFALLFSLTAWLLGMNRVAWSRAWASEADGLLVSAALAGGVALIANQVATGVSIFPPAMIIFASGLAFVGFVIARYRSRLISGFASRWMARSGAGQAVRERVLIVGGGRTGQFVAWLLSDGNSAGIFHVFGFADDDLYKQGTRYHGISVIGKRIDIPRLVAKHDIGIIVFAIHNISPAERERVLSICSSTPARVVVIPDIVGTLNDIVFEKTRAMGAEVSEAETGAGSAAPLFTSRGISPVQAQTWLADLERLAQAGDLAAVGDQIRQIREGIQEMVE